MICDISSHNFSQKIKKIGEGKGKEELEKLKSKPQIFILRLINRLGNKECKINKNKKVKEELQNPKQFSSV